MTPTNPSEAKTHEFQEILPETPVAPPDQLVIDDLNRVRLNLTAALGRTSLLVREILDLRIGSVVPMDKLAGEMTDIYVNSLLLARGEVVVIGDSLHVRIGEIIGASEKEEENEEEA